MLHADGGCICCEEQRFTHQEMVNGVNQTSRNIYFKYFKDGNKELASEMILGVCEKCYDKDEHDYEAIIGNVYEQELLFANKHGKNPRTRDFLKEIEFVSFRKK